MTFWEKKIIDAFISHYFAAAAAPGVMRTEGIIPISEERRVLRLRSSVFFPDFDTVNSDEKESYLEAAESLQHKGIVKLSWERWGRGERLRTLSCENFEMLFKESGRPFPKTEAENIKVMLGEKIKALKTKTLNETPALMNNEKTQTAENILSFLEYLCENFGPREIGRIDRQIIEDFILLLEFMLDPAGLERITTRALSILLYHDSKHLENLLSLWKPLLSKLEKNTFLHGTSSEVYQGRGSFPDFSFLERSYPETMISGKIIIEYKNEKTPLINAGGHILGIPLENTEEIVNIQPVSEKTEKTVLTIENKETFYALGTPQRTNYSGCVSHATNYFSHIINENQSKTICEKLLGFDCFLYIGGYSNRAAAALVKVLAASGFSFYHAGDLDPDGILILQNICDIAGKPVTPVRMDAITFDRYRAWARTLSKPALRQMKKIRENTRAIPGLADLLRRIEETELGVEQEIIDYR